MNGGRKGIIESLLSFFFFFVIIEPLKPIEQWITIHLYQTLEIACRLHPLPPAHHFVGLVKINFLIRNCNDMFLVSLKAVMDILIMLKCVCRSVRGH